MQKYESVWLRALCNDSGTEVGGVSILPLSCWHLFALESRRNRLVLDGAIPEACDAIDMLVVCSHSMSEGKALLSNEAGYLLECENTVSRCGLDTPTMITRCLDYIKTSTVAPDRFHSDAKRQAQGPHTWHIVRILCSEYAMKLHEAWDSRYMLGRAYFDISQESRGGVDLVSDESIFKTMDALMRHRAGGGAK